MSFKSYSLFCSFAELSKVLEPGKAAKTDKSSIITDAIRIVTQLRAENGQLRQLNKFLEVCTMRAANIGSECIPLTLCLLVYQSALSTSAQCLDLKLALGPGCVGPCASKRNTW